VAHYKLFFKINDHLVYLLIILLSLEAVVAGTG
jgi:hypothetical protein